MNRPFIVIFSGIAGMLIIALVTKAYMSSAELPARPVTVDAIADAPLMKEPSAQLLIDEAAMPPPPPDIPKEKDALTTKP